MRILEDTSFRFVETRKYAYAVSAVLIVLSIVAIVFQGFQLGIEFTGGREFIIESSVPLDAVELRQELTGVLGSQPTVKRYGNLGMLVRTAAPGETVEVQNKIMQGFQTVYPEAELTRAGSAAVSGQFADDLRRSAIYAVIGTLLVIFIYVMVRFTWMFSVGSIAALFHDVIILAGIFSAFWAISPFSMQIDQTIIAAFLTMVGYSVNDTVVVFDRIREFANIFKAQDFEKTANQSINDTLSRTFMTGVGTLTVCVVLFIFGSEVLRGFAFALLMGVIIGSYSSIYIASPIVVDIRHYMNKRRSAAGA